ncbi:MAG TPA: hypothetical protein VFK02_27745 [Kofleriaceae bacterium]|nr:hypothetical protein [Kofleriaceae bacterium]
MAGPGVVELARAAVRRLAEASPTAGGARDALGPIERVSGGPPYTVAIAGDLAARTALLDCLAGEHLFDARRHDPGRVVLSLRRGAMTALRARRRDGTVEERTLEAPPESRVDEEVTAQLTVEAMAELMTEAANGAASEAAHEAGQRAVPAAPAGTGADVLAEAAISPVAVEPTALVRRPPWWAVWRHVIHWWRAWRASRAERAGSPVPAGPVPAAAAKRAPTAPNKRPARGRAARHRRVVDPRRQFVDTIRACFADDAVERLFVEAGAGPLPDKVVVIELPVRANATALQAVGADACLVACGDQGFVMTDQLEAVLGVVPHLFVVGTAALPGGCDPRVRLLGELAAVAPALIKVATIERSLAVGGRAVAVVTAGSTAIDDAIADAEAGFRRRTERLEALRIASPDDYTARMLAGVRQAVIERVHKGIRRVLDELDDTFGRHAAAWSARLSEVTSTDALRQAAAQLDEESPTVLQAAQAQAHRALIDELTEHARAQFLELVSELRQHAPELDAVPPWLTVDVQIGELGSGTSLGSVAPRLTSLSRSVDALKADAIAQLEQRIAKLRQRASANVLDTEPRLEPAVTGTVAIALRAEVARHVAWLDAELARERAVIEAERAQLAVLAQARDTARTDARELSLALDALAAELPVGPAPRGRGPRAGREADEPGMHALPRTAQGATSPDRSPER